MQITATKIVLSLFIALPTLIPCIAAQPANWCFSGNPSNCWAGMISDGDLSAIERRQDVSSSSSIACASVTAVANPTPTPNSTSTTPASQPLTTTTPAILSGAGELRGRLYLVLLGIGMVVFGYGLIV